MSYPLPLPLSKTYTLPGHLLFYSQLTRSTCVRLGPIYQKAHSVTRIYSTPRSSVLLKSGEGFIERVQLTMYPSGCFTIRLDGKDRWIVLRERRLYISNHRPQNDGLFRCVVRGGRQCLVDAATGEAWRCWGDAGWNCYGEGAEVWCGWVGGGGRAEVGQAVREIEECGGVAGRRLGDGLDVRGVAC